MPYVASRTASPYEFIGQQTPPTYNPQPVYQPSNQNGLVWVMGEEGAKAYPVARGNTVLLLDSQDSRFYLKSMDLTGIVTIRKFKFEEISEGANKIEEVKEEPAITEAPKESEDLTKEFDEFGNGITKLLDEQLTLIKDLEDKVNRLENKQNSQWSHKTRKEDKK